MQLRHFLTSCNSGVALIEFALALPMLLILLFGTLETSYLILVHQKADKVANSMADFVTQGTTVSVANLDAFAKAVPEIMKPFTFKGTVVFTSAALLTAPQKPCPAGTPCITWQHNELGPDASRIGKPGGVPKLPGGYVIQKGQNVIVAEVFLYYTPILNISYIFVSAFTPQTLYKTALFKPRQGSLTILN